MKVAAAPSLSPETSDDLSFRARVEAELSAFLAERRALFASTAPGAIALVDELARVIEAGGKRIRPQFCLWGHRAGGGRDVDALARAGAAVELLHTAAVIHDDIVDRSPLRRGQPTTHRRFAEGSADADRFGVAAAILAGDLAQAMADELLSGVAFDPRLVLAAFEPFDRMRLDAVGGEFLDLLASRGSGGTEEDARRTGALKSGSYTVVGPLAIGAALADAPGALRGALDRYGRPLGEAFQVRDDVLGTFGDPTLTGKDRDSDIREGKRSVLVAKALRLASRRQRAVMARLGSPGLSTDGVEEIREVLRCCGALAETIALIAALAVEAKSALVGAPIDREAGAALGALADLVALRDA